MCRSNTAAVAVPSDFTVPKRATPTTWNLLAAPFVVIVTVDPTP